MMTYDDIKYATPDDDDDCPYWLERVVLVDARICVGKVSGSLWHTGMHTERRLCRFPMLQLGWEISNHKSQTGVSRHNGGIIKGASQYDSAVMVWGVSGGPSIGFWWCREKPGSRTAIHHDGCCFLPILVLRRETLPVIADPTPFTS